MEVDHIVRTMVEFGSKALILSRRVGSLYRRELKEGGKLKKKIEELEEDYDELKDKYDGATVELDDLKNCIIQEHINDFEKGLRQVAFFHQEVDITDSKFDVNNVVIDGKIVKEGESSPDEEEEKEAAEEAKEAGDAEEVAPDAAG
ncbi:hypothetical protein DEO72_LG10g1915 [Vigna unguiculata]|uniref:Uncharacterized protein n=1 Tax=Vigna unguiculata TaxID=3917 RepID=A0A4D6ND54_VIGUN|nr:hypothetical protein DEO72_LG10g1915 [Vigna unguiculata]